MTTSSSNTGTVTPDTHGNEGGGGLNVPCPPAPPVVTNQQLLVLDNQVLSGIPDFAARKVKLVQLEFARDVSALAVTAYNRLIEELGPHRD